MEGKLQIICDALVACLEEVPREQYPQASVIIQQMIFHLLHKLSGGKVNKVHFNAIGNATVVVNSVVATQEGTASNPEDIKEKDNVAAVDVDQQADLTAASKEITASELSEAEVVEIEAHIAQSQEPITGTPSSDIDPVPMPESNQNQTVRVDNQFIKLEMDSKEEEQKLKLIRESDCQRSKCHDGTQMFVCSICQRPFKEKAKLKRHLLIHAGIRPFSCHICSHKFTQKTHLKDHLNTHTGEKKYRCPDCDRQFSFLRNLRRHCKLHLKKPEVLKQKWFCAKCRRYFKKQESVKVHKCIGKNRSASVARVLRLQAPRCKNLLGENEGNHATEAKEDLVVFDQTEDLGNKAVVDAASNSVPDTATAQFADSDVLKIKPDTGNKKIKQVLSKTQPNVVWVNVGSSDLGLLTLHLQQSGMTTSPKGSHSGHAPTVTTAPGTSLLKKNFPLNDKTVNVGPPRKRPNTSEDATAEQFVFVGNIKCSQPDRALPKAAVPDVAATKPSAIGIQPWPDSAVLAVDSQAGPLQTLVDAATAVAMKQQDGT